MGVGVHFVRDAFCTATASEMGMLEIFLLLSLQSNMHVRWKSGPEFSADSENPMIPVAPSGESGPGREAFAYLAPVRLAPNSSHVSQLVSTARWHHTDCASSVARLEKGTSGTKPVVECGKMESHRRVLPCAMAVMSKSGTFE